LAEIDAQFPDPQQVMPQVSPRRFRSVGLKRVLISSLAGALAYYPLLALAPSVQAQPSPAQVQQQTVVLGVVRSSDSSMRWRDVVDRLQASGVVYQVVDWQQVKRSTDLGNVTVLFLPNIETISSEQLLALQSWMNRGGRVIVSGPTGKQSSSGVRQALRSLLGAYWTSALPQPATLQPVVVSSSQAWLQEGDTSNPVQGGVVVPASLVSQPIAVWNNSSAGVPNGAAVVITQQSTFLGWRWGSQDSGSVAFDSSWLRAALSRYRDAPPLLPATAQVSGTASVATHPSSVSTSPAAASAPPRSMAPVPARPLPSRAPASTAASALSATPSRSDSTANTAQNSTQNSAATAAQRRDALLAHLRSAAPPLQPSESDDPADQAAPPEPTQRNPARITLYEATLMRQELENLIGRYESALITANSATASPDLTGAKAAAPAQTSRRSDSREPTLTASTDRALLVSANTGSSSVLSDRVLQEARQGLAAFSQALSQQDAAAARQQWFQTCQLLRSNFPIDRPLAQTEIRAMWLDRGTIVRAGSRQGLARIFDQLKAAGINTVFFETVNAGYPIYPSQVAPQQNPLTRQWDPLQAAVELAHERKMELHAWVWAFAAGNQAHNYLLNLPADYPGPVIAAHPNWANFDNRGSMIPPGQKKPFLDPANPEVRQYLLRLFEEIVSRYDVDGLQLDYIRYPFQDPRMGGHTYGYGLAARQQFQAMTGVDPIALSPYSTAAAPEQQSRDRQLWQQWTDFRTEQISSFVADTSRLVHRLKPNLILSAAVFALPEQQRLREIQQNWEAWAQQGDVDLITLMSYASDTNGLQRLASPWLSEEAKLGSVLVLPGIRLLNLSEAEIVEQIQTLRDSSAGGFALFAVDNLNDSLQTIFNQTQGAVRSQSTEPIPYRQPFAAASSRYMALQRQWSFLLSQGQLQMQGQELETWRTQAAALGQTFENLANHPSNQTLQQAKTQLREFRTRFSSWMQLPALSQDYRVRTWENHLATLENLLDYGQRVVLQRQESQQQASGELQ
jgi:uncharacterized lipoprotein YddW (UPF0748 family)